MSVLDPLEVGDGHTASVRQDVGYDRHAALLEGGIGCRANWRIRRLDDQPCPHLAHIARVDGIFQRRRHQDVYIEREKLVIRHRLHTR